MAAASLFGGMTSGAAAIITNKTTLRWLIADLQDTKQHVRNLETRLDDTRDMAVKARVGQNTVSGGK